MAKIWRYAVNLFIDFPNTTKMEWIRNGNKV